jgi:hypothetical protein
MTATGIFADDDRLRPIWRFFLSVVFIFAAFVVAAESVGVFTAIGRFHPSELTGVFWRTLVGLAAVMAAYKFLTSVYERRPLGSVGWAFHRRWWKELGRGLWVGAVMLALAVGLEWAGGYVRLTFVPHPMLRAGSFGFIMFAVAAVFEETVFRGYPLQRLAEAITPAGAVVVDSALFGLVHLGNPHETWLSTLNTTLVGAAFCVAYLRTRALWMPVGMHFMWNFLLGPMLGLPVSGMTIARTMLDAHVQGPRWLTGGTYGPEGGLLATIAILLVTLYLLFTKSIYTSEEMKALVFAPVASTWPERPITIFSVPPEK